MKSIFVTVQEFINNGGELNQLRALYHQQADGDFKEIGWFDKNVQIPAPYCIIVSKSNGTFQSLIEVVHVEIECTPIYK